MSPLLSGKCDHKDYMEVLKIIESAEKLQDITPLWVLALRQSAQGRVVEKNLSCTRLAKVVKRVETKVIWRVEMAL